VWRTTPRLFSSLLPPASPVSRVLLTISDTSGTMLVASPQAAAQGPLLLKGPQTGMCKPPHVWYGGSGWTRKGLGRTSHQPSPTFLCSLEETPGRPLQGGCYAFIVSGTTLLPPCGTHLASAPLSQMWVHSKSLGALLNLLCLHGSSFSCTNLPGAEAFELGQQPPGFSALLSPSSLGSWEDRRGSPGPQKR
jgi:hypothetical protein